MSWQQLPQCEIPPLLHLPQGHLVSRPRIEIGYHVHQSSQLFVIRRLGHSAGTDMTPVIFSSTNTPCVSWGNGCLPTSSRPWRVNSHLPDERSTKMPVASFWHRPYSFKYSSTPDVTCTSPAATADSFIRGGDRRAEPQVHPLG
jgi:hypothetical protein